LKVKEQFKKFDADSDGRITSEEMEQVCWLHIILLYCCDPLVTPPQQGMCAGKDFTREQAQFAFSCADTNEDNHIDISEFVQLFFPSAKEVLAMLSLVAKS
jgi:Ca2+-binding EF-hand superfamily protein